MAAETVPAANLLRLPGADRPPVRQGVRRRQTRADLLLELRCDELRRQIKQEEKKAEGQRLTGRLYEARDGRPERLERVLAYRYGAALYEWQAEKLREELRALRLAQGDTP